MFEHDSKGCQYALRALTFVVRKGATTGSRNAFKVSGASVPTATSKKDWQIHPHGARKWRCTTSADRREGLISTWKNDRSGGSSRRTFTISDSGHVVTKNISGEYRHGQGFIVEELAPKTLDVGELDAQKLQT